MMCWCKDCEWYYKEHCANRLSDNCTEMMGEHNSCEHSEIKADAITEEYGKGFGDGYREAMDSK